MRWVQLFEDLEGGWDAERSRAFAAAVSDRTRAERADVDLAARLAGARGTPLTVALSDGSRISGVLADSTAQWILLHAGSSEHLVPIRAVSAVLGLSSRIVPVSEVERRLSLGAALRALARDRSRVTVEAAGLAVTGTLGAVGADHVDVASDGGAEIPAAVPFAAILQVRSARA